MNTVMARQSELETNLKIARSNLVLAENHAEALEDTIKRNPSSRLSNGSGTMLGYSPVPPPVPAFPSYGSSPAGTSSGITVRTSSKSPNPPQGSFGDHHDPDSATLPSPRLGSFWKRKAPFAATSHSNPEGLSKQQQHDNEPYDTQSGKRSSTSLGINHPVRSVNNAAKSDHRLSYETASEDEGNATIMRRPSFGMLRSSSANIPGSGNDKATAALINSLQSQLSQSKQTYSILQAEYQTLQTNHATLSKKYTSLQDEIENLSVSLFEEANTMVAEERKVNSFLNETLDKTKAEVNDLQRQVEELKAALADRDRVASPALSMKSHRRRTSTSSNHPSHPGRSRRRSSIAALDALETYVASSPRRASRDLAAAAAAVRSLGQSHNSELPSLPHSASVNSFNKLHLSTSNTTRSPASSISAPTTAALPSETAQQVQSTALEITAERNEDEFDTIRKQRDNTPRDGQSRSDSLEPHDTSEDQAPTSASSYRARWFSFGSRRRPKIDHPQSTSQAQGGSLSPQAASSSPVNGGSNQVQAGQERLSPRGPPRSPDRSQKHTRLNSSFSPEMFRPGLPAVSEGMGIPHPKSPIISLSQNVQHLVSPSARPGHARGQSTSSLKDTSTSRPASPFSPTGTDNSGRSVGLNRSLSAFSSPAGRRPGTGPRELILLSGGSATSSPHSTTHSPRRETSLIKQQQRASIQRSPRDDERSPDGSLSVPRSPSQPRYMPVSELHSILDQINTDELPTSFSRLASPQEERNQPKAHVPFADLQAQLEPTLSKPAMSSLRSHKKSWSISSDRPRSSTPVDNSPSSRNTVVAPSGESTGQRPLSQGVSPDAAVPLSLNKSANPRLKPIDTALQSHVNGLESNKGKPSAEPLSPFALPTPPIFKRFPRDTGYRPPLKSPSKSEAMALQRSGSSGLGSSRDLQRSGSTASNASFSRGFDPTRFGLQRQNSTMSVGTGSVVEDLDTLMKSIDAISESLGLEADGLDASFYEQAAVPPSP